MGEIPVEIPVETPVEIPVETRGKAAADAEACAAVIRPRIHTGKPPWRS